MFDHLRSRSFIHIDCVDSEIFLCRLCDTESLVNTCENSADEESDHVYFGQLLAKIR